MARGEGLGSRPECNLTPSGLHTVVLKVDAALATAYGDQQFDGRSDPLDSLIRTILSQNTTNRNSARAYDGLVKAFGGWGRVAAAEVGSIAEAIRPGGLAKRKAVHIKTLLERIIAEQGRASLELLAAMDNAEAVAYLRQFTGVGPKTAACVLMFSLGRQVFPVDTHVRRIAERLGWVPPRLSDEAIHEALTAVVAPELRYQLHVNMVAHGRHVCRPRRPGCGACCIRAQCDYAGGTG